MLGKLLCEKSSLIPKYLNLKGVVLVINFVFGMDSKPYFCTFEWDRFTIDELCVTIAKICACIDVDGGIEEINSSLRRFEVGKVVRVA